MGAGALQGALNRYDIRLVINSEPPVNICFN